MQNHNIIDISDLAPQEKLLAINFLEFLKSKSKNVKISNGNYDKNKLIKAIYSAKDSNVFNDIDDSVKWQVELRNEWE